MADTQTVLEALKHSHVFLTGGAGTGKSYTTAEVIRHYRKEGKQVVALGSTGVSAVNIGGFTIHSFFVFGIASNFDELAQHDRYNKKRLNELKKILRATDLIVIDEISMVSAQMLEMIYFRLLQAGYGGKVLFVGDFFQLPPVRKRAEAADIFGDKLYAFEADAWEKFDPFIIELTEMKRTHDAEFTHILSKVRRGICDEEVRAYMHRLWNQAPPPDATRLYGRNEEVERINREELNRIPHEETILFAEITLHKKMHEKRLEQWIRNLPVTRMLTLKVGAPVLFTVNKWGKFVNGERGIVHAIEEDYIIVDKGEEFVRVERHDFELSEMEAEQDGTITPVEAATLSQFPLKLAYAVTIHKSQGMSIDGLVCNVDHIFAPSQFYVAVSRAVDPRRLAIEYNRGDLMRYLDRVIHVDERVGKFMDETVRKAVS
jgi:ATP-dependent exoDNAse (exonuclease V) alpha subunit